MFRSSSARNGAVDGDRGRADEQEVGERLRRQLARCARRVLARSIASSRGIALTPLRPVPFMPRVSFDAAENRKQLVRPDRPARRVCRTIGEGHPPFEVRPCEFPRKGESGPASRPARCSQRYGRECRGGTTGGWPPSVASSTASVASTRHPPPSGAPARPGRAAERGPDPRPPPLPPPESAGHPSRPGCPAPRLHPPRRRRSRRHRSRRRPLQETSLQETASQETSLQETSVQETASQETSRLDHVRPADRVEDRLARRRVRP